MVSTEKRKMAVNSEVKEQDKKDWTGIRRGGQGREGLGSRGGSVRFCAYSGQQWQ